MAKRQHLLHSAPYQGKISTLAYWRGGLTDDFQLVFSWLMGSEMMLKAGVGKFTHATGG